MTSNRHKYEAPRWLYESLQVPSLSEGRIPPSSFQNTTPYRWRLYGISFTGEYPNRRGTTITTLPTDHPPWTKDLLVDIGKSGCSDQNLVRSSLLALCANPRHSRLKWGANNMGRSYILPRPYRLPQNEGLTVEVSALWSGFSGNGSIPEMTFIAKGYDGVEGYPVVLAGSVDGLTIDGSASQINSADLFNNGKNAAYITELCFKDMDTIGPDDSADYRWIGSGRQVAWRVNPANPSFTQWMPRPEHIPLGNLTPLDRNYDGGNESPLCYFFPQNEPTYLDPKQAISITVGNQAADQVVLGVSVFGQLEIL